MNYEEKMRRIEAETSEWAANDVAALECEWCELVIIETGGVVTRCLAHQGGTG